jgi:methyl-accepting chemotaxis protein
MSEIESIEAASRRLALALEALDAAVERRRDADREVEALADQIHALGSDRARLAGELDFAAARSRRLASAGREVAQRIDQAIAAIRGVLGDKVSGVKELDDDELDDDESDDDELDDEESDDDE